MIIFSYWKRIGLFLHLLIKMPNNLLSCGELVADTINVFANCSPNHIFDLLSLGSYLFLTANVPHQERASSAGFQNKRNNFKNTTVIAAAVDQPSFYYSVKFKLPEESNDIDEFEGGINVEAYRFLRDSLNFREKAIKSRGQMYADDKGELQNEGIAKVLNSDLADLAISLYEPLPYRVAGPYGVRFLHSVFKSSKAIAVFTQPPKNSARNIYGLPFQPGVWVGLCLLYVLIIVIIWLFMVTSENYGNSVTSYVGILRESHFWMLCILTRQGISDTSFNSTRNCIRLVLLAGFISTVIFHSQYTSALTSIFAGDYKPISIASQLITKHYTMYFDKYVPVIKNILENYSSESNITIVEMGGDAETKMKKAVPEIFDSKSALLTSEDRAYPFFSGKYHDSFLCNKLSMVPLAGVSIRSANFVKQGSSFRDIFNTKFLLMQQSGLIERLYKEYNLKSTLTCLPSFEPDFVRLDIYDTAFPFLIFLYISFISLCFLLGESVVMNGAEAANKVRAIICERLTSAAS